jgi:hypothetical protein
MVNAVAGTLPAARRRTHAPLDGVQKAVHRRAAGLRRAGIEQIGADRGRGVNAEQQDEQRRHQRAAPDASHAHQRTDRESAQRVEQIDRVDEVHGSAVPLAQSSLRSPDAVQRVAKRSGAPLIRGPLCASVAD